MIKVKKQYFLMTVIFHRWWFWGFLVAQAMKNPSAMWETWVQSVGWKDPLEEGMATHSNILAWRIPMNREAWRATVHGVGRVRHNWVTKRAHTVFNGKHNYNKKFGYYFFKFFFLLPYFPVWDFSDRFVRLLKFSILCIFMEHINAPFSAYS